MFIFHLGVHLSSQVYPSIFPWQSSIKIHDNLLCYILQHFVPHCFCVWFKANCETNIFVPRWQSVWLHLMNLYLASLFTIKVMLFLHLSLILLCAFGYTIYLSYKTASHKDHNYAFITTHSLLPACKIIDSAWQFH